ncbi:cell division ATP-binding protein FtsE [Candidatus Saccharibacteria bacterium]|nr:cell division ATP-binding protein FtsE [Candidatus Saccharibacteria bacterium]
MILLDRVTKVYGKEANPALNRVSLHIGPKEFVILVGTSGAGKSTLLKLLTREEKPTSGKIVVGGIDYDTLKDKHIPLLRRKIGTVFQDFKLLPNRTVYENVAFAMEIVGMSNREIASTVPRVIELVGLEGKAKKFPHQLSGGEKQRVAIARAVARQPKILIADEPTGNLDPKHSWDIVRLLEKINRYGTTVLLTTHNQEIVNKLQRRVITIDHGKLVGDQAVGTYQQGVAPTDEAASAPQAPPAGGQPRV